MLNILGEGSGAQGEQASEQLMARAIQVSPQHPPRSPPRLAPCQPTVQCQTLHLQCCLETLHQQVCKVPVFREAWCHLLAKHLMYRVFDDCFAIRGH